MARVLLQGDFLRLSGRSASAGCTGRKAMRLLLHATIFTAMGISPKTEYSIEGRPFYATRDGHGKAVRDVFA